MDHMAVKGELTQCSIPNPPVCANASQDQFDDFCIQAVRGLVEEQSGTEVLERRADNRARSKRTSIDDELRSP